MAAPASEAKSDDDTHSAEEEEPTHVLNLPQLYQRPSADTLLAVLADLSIAPPSWEVTPSGVSHELAQRKRKINSEGIPAYLTKIISSSLDWIENDEEKESIWELAAQRLSERSGRSAMGAFSRTFDIPMLRNENTVGDDQTMKTGEDALHIVLHEPALTADNLGLKTWASSYLLAKRLNLLRETLPTLSPNGHILELGAGTGLVGLAAAAIFQSHVILTDLPEIVTNLERNLQANAATLASYNGSAETAILDWSNPASFTLSSGPPKPYSFPLILAADPLYSREHPRLLVQAIAQHLQRSARARVVIELPLRDAYATERKDLRERMKGLGLVVLGQGEEVGFDDWGDGSDEGLREVKCWWGVWGWA